MPDDERLIYWDSCCFLSYVNDDVDRADTLDVLLTDSKNERSPLKIITSTLAITEVAYAELEKVEELSPDEMNAAIESLWADTDAIRLIEFSRAIAERARHLIRRASFRGERLTITDAIHLASAVQMQAKEFHTYDGALKKFEDITGLSIAEPTMLQAATVSKPISSASSEQLDATAAPSPASS